MGNFIHKLFFHEINLLIRKKIVTLDRPLEKRKLGNAVMAEKRYKNDCSVTF